MGEAKRRWKLAYMTATVDMNGPPFDDQVQAHMLEKYPAESAVSHNHRYVRGNNSGYPIWRVLVAYRNAMIDYYRRSPKPYSEFRGRAAARFERTTDAAKDAGLRLQAELEHLNRPVSEETAEAAGRKGESILMHELIGKFDVPPYVLREWMPKHPETREMSLTIEVPNRPSY